MDKEKLRGELAQVLSRIEDRIGTKATAELFFDKNGNFCCKFDGIDDCDELRNVISSISAAKAEERK